MKSFKIYDDDLVITENDIQMIDSDDEVCQCIERAITTRIKEWFLNSMHGMDYNELKQKNPDIERIKLDITEAAMQEERLKYIKEINVDFDALSRVAKIDLIGILKNGNEVYLQGVGI